MASRNPAEGHRKRLRERFRKNSLTGFHDYEVLELLLTYAIPRMDVKPLAKALLKRFKGLKGVFDATPEELESVSGVGGSTAVIIPLLKGVAEEYLKESVSEKIKVFSPEDVVRSLAASGPVPEGEHLCAVYLNSKNEVLGVEVLHKGSLTDASVSPKRAIEKAFSHNARSVIFVHCVPDGGLRAAEIGPEERRLVKGLKEAATAIDILVHDHIVLGKDAHYSARENGLLED